MSDKYWEDRISRLEKFSENKKLIFNNRSIKRIIAEMRELWSELQAARAQGEPADIKDLMIASDMLEDYASALDNGDLDGAGHSLPSAVRNMADILNLHASGANQGGVPEGFQKSGVWQFYQDGEWRVGMNCNNHRQNTEEVGVPTRDLYALIPRPNKPEQEWVRCSDRMPRLGQRVILEKNGVVQHYMPILDQADIDGSGNGGEHFWDFEDEADECSPVDYERDRWMALPPQEQRGAE